MRRITRRLQYVVNMIIRHPCVLFCSILVCFAVGCAWFSCRGENVSVFPKHWPLFTVKAKVHEITNGSLDTLSSFLKRSPLKFVLFYAPWCGQSRTVVPQFSRTANILHEEVEFIAINCWTGTCKSRYVLDSFPKLFVYHTDFPGVQYPEDYDVHSSYMVRFLHDIIRPFSHITTELELQELKAKKQEVVLSYLDNLENRSYMRYFGAALSYVREVSRPSFGLITDINVARRAGLTSNAEILFYRVFNPTLRFSPTLNTTILNITEWIAKSRKELIVELVPNSSNKNVLESKLVEKPAVILFLPLRRQNISSPLLTLLMQVSTHYHNCSCGDTSTRAQTRQLESQPQKERFLFSQVNSNNVRPSRTLTGSLDKITKEEYLCLSIVLKNTTPNKWNVCEMCFTKISRDHHGDVFDVILNRLRTNGLRIPSSCSSLQIFYYPAIKTNICCGRGTQSAKQRKIEQLRKAFRLSNDEILQQKFEKVFNILYNKLLKAVEPLGKGDFDNENVYSGLQATKGEIHGEISRPPSAAVSTGSVMNNSTQRNTSVNNTNETVNTTDGCIRLGRVSVFHGASCHSNRSVNFFYMDTGRFWSVAQRLGVTGSPADLKSKVALAIVDVKNEVHHVLDEELPINNRTIVEFVMHFMNTRLKQTLRSEAVPTNACPKSIACVIEVTSATLDAIVMNEDKDVLLVYYAHWCGFCINLSPVLLTVARFFKDSKHVTIARIDADKNDLPWQHTVAVYPTIILFPAKRKDFSVRYPDESERTAESLIKFILKHGTSTSSFETDKDYCKYDVINTRIEQLESSVLRVEREKQFLESRLEGILMEKSLLGLKNSKLQKGFIAAQEAAKNERDSRISIEGVYKQSEQSRRELNEKYMSLVLRSTKLELEITDLKEKRHILEGNCLKHVEETKKSMLVIKEIQGMNEVLVKKLEKAEYTISHLRTRDRMFARKIRLLQRTLKALYWKYRQITNDNAKNKQLIKEAKEEKRLLSLLLSSVEETVRDLKASLSSAEEKLEEEKSKRSSVMKENSEANQKLEKMKINYEKLTVILSQIDIPKEQQTS